MLEGSAHRRSPQRPLRVAILAPPLLPVPPPRYGGIERVVGLLADGLERLGHEVTVFAAGGSRVAGRLVPVVPRALWSDAPDDKPPLRDPGLYLQLVIARAMDHELEFDLIHSHLECQAFVFARRARVPVITTMHGRLDSAGTAEMLAEFRELPLVSISRSQRRWHPDNNWLATIYNAVGRTNARGDGRGGYLCFVGRIAPEKGVVEAIELARRTGMRLRVAAKVRDAGERELYEQVVAPAERAGVVEFLGELDDESRDELYAGALATVMLGGWPEPFGLTAAESLAVGTPVIARRAGALPEIVRPGVDGFVVDDLEEALLALREVERLDRDAMRASARQRFTPERMAREYEAAYLRLLGLPALDQPRGDPLSLVRTA